MGNLFTRFMRFSPPTIFTAAALMVLAVSRLATAPDYLVTFDGANFSLAIENYRPDLHQPQPPGYPLFVLLAQTLRGVTPGPEEALLWCGIAGAGVAVLSMRKLAQAWHGERAFQGAAVLLITNPILWFGGLTNPVRTFLAAGSCLVAWLCRRAWNAERASTASLVWAGFAYGLSGGFREQAPIVLLPLWAVLLWRWRGRPAAVAAAVGAAGLAVCGWLGYAVARSGGPANYWLLITSYAQAQMSPMSVLFGASLTPALRMLLESLLWNTLTAAPALWAIRWFRPGTTPWAFAALWFVPGMAFQAFFHNVDPDHALVTVPIVALFGGMALAGVTRWSWVLAGGINVWLFFSAPLLLPVQPSYRIVRVNEEAARGTVEDLRAARERGPMQGIIYNSGVSWRVLGYYLRDTPFFLVENDGASGAAPVVACVARAMIGACSPPEPPMLLDGSKPTYVITGADPDLRARLGMLGARDAGPSGVLFPAGTKFDFSLGAVRFSAR